MSIYKIKFLLINWPTKIINFALLLLKQLHMEKQYQSLKEFYPFYLSQHQNKTSRMLHIMGTSLFIFFFFGSFIFHEVNILLFSPIVAYGFAWIGHFFFEKNKQNQ